jgi:hypothetical protein
MFARTHFYPFFRIFCRNIKEEPFKIPDETYDDLMYTFFSPEREGWLLKQVPETSRIYLLYRSRGSTVVAD